MGISGISWSASAKSTNEAIPLKMLSVTTVSRKLDSGGSRSLGPNAELFLIDAKNGSLGEDQVTWICEAVEESTRTWKVC